MTSIVLLATKKHFFVPIWPDARFEPRGTVNHRRMLMLIDTLCKRAFSMTRVCVPQKAPTLRRTGTKCRWIGGRLGDNELRNDSGVSTFI